MKARDIFDFILLAAIWGGSFLFMKIAGPEFGVFPSMALRTGVAALMLLPLVLMRGLGEQLRMHWQKTLGIGVLNSGLPFVLFAFATLHLTAGFTSILNSSVPFWSALIAWLWLGDKPRRLQVLGLVIAFIGVVMLVWGKVDLQPGGAGWAILACLLATLLYGLSANITKRVFAGVNPLVSAAGSHSDAGECRCSCPGQGTAAGQFPQSPLARAVEYRRRRRQRHHGPGRGREAERAHRPACIGG